MNADSTIGSLGTGIVMRGARTLKEDGVRQLLLGKPSESERLTYSSGAGWTRTGQFSSGSDWNGSLARFADRLKYPLQVTLLPPR